MTTFACNKVTFGRFPILFQLKTSTIATKRNFQYLKKIYQGYLVLLLLLYFEVTFQRVSFTFIRVTVITDTFTFT